jgi:16S rRNA (guanine966-N2)-methyltransferase
MRIKSGRLKGRKIKTLPITDTKPTKSETREALFNILKHNVELQDYDFSKNEINFLEVFCGTGIMSFEALSNGAKRTISIDNNPNLKRLFEENKTHLGIGDEATFCISHATTLPECYEKSDLCYIDPPYYKNLEIETLKNLHKKNWLNEKALVIMETGFKTDLESHDSFQFLFNRKYGKSKLHFFIYKS